MIMCVPFYDGYKYGAIQSLLKLRPLLVFLTKHNFFTSLLLQQHEILFQDGRGTKEQDLREHFRLPPGKGVARNL